MDETSQKRAAPLFILLAALIWGGSFVAQSAGGDLAGPFGFTLARAALATLMLLPFALSNGRGDITRALRSGTLCGFILFTSQSFQQIGMYMGTAAGKAGFLTSSSLLFVPMLETFLGNKCPRKVWIATAAAFGGLYLLCVRDGFSVEVSDIFILTCALTWAIHIIVVNRAVRTAAPTSVMMVQFASSILFSLPPTLLFDTPKFGGFIEWLSVFKGRDALIAVLYAGLLANGVAYVLQGIGQKHVSTTITVLIMSLEAVFAASAGAVLLGETLTTREMIGSAILLVAVIAAQLPSRHKAR